MRLIDADALKDKCYITVNGTTIGRTNYVMFHEIDEAPTIDAVQVVRCKDCIHWKADNEVFELGFCCVFPQKWVAETFYCADGERREP